MLQLKQIVKKYTIGDYEQPVLKGVSISFRENEFVSILGQSGSGKTTMLNIIGGLDRYTSGDLLINGVSTKHYKDADWDYYRNNSIGFVFQSYNLIPHQSVLANVEMALTLAGVSKSERRRRAIDVLKKVGLADHIHKKPNQMSGGQMQRVAIARALINNPDILLADEPTGALDSETSIQIMELLKEIAKDKLVIMVTHNPELAEQYSTRIVRLKDGVITDDSNPYTAESKPVEKKKNKKISMSFATALSLSFNNLKTKKGRTLLTAFAGSIGIIGIALILAVSTGMNTYISDIQKETMTSYPLTISAETVDLSSIMGQRQEIIEARRNGDADETDASVSDTVHADFSDIETSEAISASVVENNLTNFKKYLETDEDVQACLGENGIVYSYDVNFDVFSYNDNQTLVNSDADVEKLSSLDTGSTGEMLNARAGLVASMMGSSDSGAENFSELIPGKNGEAVSSLVTDNYDLMYGTWPSAYDEVVLVLNRNNSISSGTLYQLGLITEEQYLDAVNAIKAGNEADDIKFDADALCGHTFYLLPACDQYEKNEDGTFSQIDTTALTEDTLLSDAIPLKISGIIRPTDDTDTTNIQTAVGYTSLLTDYIIDHTDKSDIVTAQEASPDINVLTGVEFEAGDDASKAEDAKEYIRTLDVSTKAYLYKTLAAASAQSGTNVPAGVDVATAQTNTDAIPAGTGMGNTANLMDGSTTTDGSSLSPSSGASMDETTMASMLDQWLNADPDEEMLVRFYDQYISGASYEDNLKAFGKVSYDAPASINIYVDSFEAKEQLTDCIDTYNQSAGEDDKITYTDYVAMLTSSVTTIINGISYVLIAFVAISLVVSCIMIGIITHISVMERTKEIGILRALGASKRNISQVFNAETCIIGCCSGILGIVLSEILIIPINAIIQKVSGISDITAQLSVTAAIILILISVFITILGGLFPAKKAAKKDPVIALRTE